MNRQDDRDRRLQNVLESWFLLEDSGHRPDLASLCEGDEDLMDQVRSLLSLDPLARMQDDGRAKTSLDDLPVTELGEFTLLGLLGEGGMGRVYLAQQASLGRYVALKILDRKSGMNEIDRRRFRREAAIAASLEHPNIVPIYGSGEEQGLLWLAMKWLSGPSLGELEQKPSPRQVAEFGMSIARALDVAHQAGVMHRDIKPENIILNEGVPHLVDFGLSCAVSDEKLTREGVVPGTLAFLAPEYLDGSSPHFDPRSDIYSLGATLYHLIRGRHPFEGASAERLVHAVLNEDPPSLGLEGVDRDLETIILRCLDKLPHRRFHTAVALADDLSRYLAGMPIHSRKMTSVYRAVRFIRRHSRASIAVSSLLILVLLFFGLWYLDRAADRIKRQELVRVIESAWTRRDLLEVETGVATYRRSFGNDENSTMIGSMLGSLRAYERLMDQLVEGPEEQSPTIVDSVLRSSVEGEAHLVDRRLVEMARTVLKAYLGEIDERSSETAISDPGKRPDSDWLLPLLDGTTMSVAPEKIHSVDELTIMLAAARYAERPDEEIAAIIDHATRIDPTSYRAHYARAMQLMSQSDYARADEKFQTLPLSGHPDAVHDVHRLWIAAATRDFALAESILAHKHVVSGRFYLALAKYREAAGDVKAAEEAVANSLEVDDGDSSVMIAAATWYTSRGQSDRARPLLEKVLSGRTSPFHRDLARAISHLIRLETIAKPLEFDSSQVTEQSVYSAVRATLGDLHELAERGRGSRIRALALEGESRCCAILAAFEPKYLERAFECAKRSVEVNPNSARTRMFLLGIIGIARKPMSKADAELFLSTFDGLCRLHDRGSLNISAQEWRSIQFKAVEVAVRFDMRDRAFDYLMAVRALCFKDGVPDQIWLDTLNELIGN